MTNKALEPVELLPCPFCGGKAEIRLHRYQGTGASGMETPEPYAACKTGCAEMKPVRCDDWPYGRAHGYLTSKEARAEAIRRWNTRSAQPVGKPVERVARAILTVKSPRLAMHAEEFKTIHWTEALLQARAAIEAMNKITPEGEE